MRGGDGVGAAAVHIVRGLSSPVPNPEPPPAEPGFYAWWARPAALSRARPAIPLAAVAGVRGWSLLYVGIAPKRAVSRQTLKSRVRTHRRGNIGSSTLRQSLAALLGPSLGLTPRPGTSRARLIDEAALTNWIRDNCALSWASWPTPWLFEGAVISRLGPPLNLGGSKHPFRGTVESARDALWEECGLPRRPRRSR